VRERAIRVAVRCDRRLFRDALAAFLQARPEYDVVGRTAGLDDLIALCDLRRPDVVLIDVEEGIGHQPDSLMRLRRCVTRTRVVIVYERLAPVETRTLLGLGIDQFVPCSQGLDGLLIVLRRYLSVRTSVAPDGLNERERDIIQLMTAGHTADQIALLLGVTASTVANTKRRLHQKLYVESQSQAVARATALGLVEPAPVAQPELPELTAREWDILHSIGDGHTVRQTARLLGIAEKTVQNTQARLFYKLGARNRCGAVAAAHALGLLAPEPAR
jgi:two-component system nitrate/nitrite response regulator NarL